MSRLLLMIILTATFGGSALGAQASEFGAAESARPAAKPRPAVRFAALLKGRMLRQFANSSEAGGVQSEKTIHFCSNGRFFFSSMTVISGGGASGTERQQQAGRWKVVRAVFDVAGDAVGIVRLIPSRGRAESAEIVIARQGTLINRERAFRVRSTRCR